MALLGSTSGYERLSSALVTIEKVNEVFQTTNFIGYWIDGHGQTVTAAATLNTTVLIWITRTLWIPRKALGITFSFQHYKWKIRNWTQNDGTSKGIFTANRTSLIRSVPPNRCDTSNPSALFWGRGWMGFSTWVTVFSYGTTRTDGLTKTNEDLDGRDCAAWIGWTIGNRTTGTKIPWTNSDGVMPIVSSSQVLPNIFFIFHIITYWWNKNLPFNIYSLRVHWKIPISYILLRGAV